MRTVIRGGFVTLVRYQNRSSFPSEYFMEINISTQSPRDVESSCLIVGVWQDEPLSGLAAEINESVDNLLSHFIDDGFKRSAGEVRMVYHVPILKAERAIVVGLGKRDKFSAKNLHKAISKAARTARNIKRDELAFVLPDSDALGTRELATAVTEGAVLGLHVYNAFKTDDEAKNLTDVKSITLIADQKHSENHLRAGADYAAVVAQASIRAREWVELPSNKKSPQFLAFQAEQIADENENLSCEIWDENRLREENMNALIGVGQGSDNPPRLIKLEYSPEKPNDEAPLILVGKGVTFDTGGYSLKPAANMEDMKDDMAGAAVVLASMEAIAELKPKRRVIGLVGSVENMISGRAQRPGDIVQARNGKTIEVLNTDAEGRLVLSDVLSYASELKPAAIVDYATLTGAIGIALGQEAAGLFSNDDELSQKIVAAGEATNERVWPFPMWDEYKDHIKGAVADIKNMGKERRAGSIAGAVFLQHFVGEGIPWAHIDIAAVSYVREDRPLSSGGATGFGVRLTLELLKQF
jgi:leucyl aminopeptidase